MSYFISVCCIVLLLISGCKRAEQEAKLNQYAAGEQLYSSYCASCHEIEGGIGPILSKKVLATRVNARYLFNYNKANMPYEAGNTLSEDQYWNITAYLLVREGFMAPSEQLNHLTADTLKLE